MNASEVLHRDFGTPEGHPKPELTQLEFLREIENHVSVIKAMASSGIRMDIQCSTPEVERAVRQRTEASPLVRFLSPKSVSGF